MSAAEYYGNSNSGGGADGHRLSHFHNPPPYHQPQYTASPSHSPYPSQPTYAQPPAQSQNHLSPYPSQPQYARPGSAHSDAGYPPSLYRGDRPGSAYPSPLPRPRSADPYSSDHTNRDPIRAGHADQEDGERGLGATLIGGGASGVLGHKLGKGKLGTLLGSAVGAVAANVIENKLEGRHGKHSGHHGHSPYSHRHSHANGHDGSSGGLLGSASSFLGVGSSHHGPSHNSSYHGSHYHGGHDGHHGHNSHHSGHHSHGW